MDLSCLTSTCTDFDSILSGFLEERGLTYDLLVRSVDISNNLFFTVVSPESSKHFLLSWLTKRKFPPQDNIKKEKNTNKDIFLVDWTQNSLI